MVSKGVALGTSVVVVAAVLSMWVSNSALIPSARAVQEGGPEPITIGLECPPGSACGDIYLASGCCGGMTPWSACDCVDGSCLREASPIPVYKARPGTLGCTMAVASTICCRLGNICFGTVQGGGCNDFSPCSQFQNSSDDVIGTVYAYTGVACGLAE